jgi:CubicO group peptidase (beta-lactamase class C family)
MTMLAEVVRRVDGRRFERYVREEVFEPLGMTDCWVGMPAGHHAGYGDRVGTMHATADPDAGAVPLAALDSVAALGRCVPGGGGRGPMHQYARLHRALLRGGTLDGVRVLTPQSVDSMAARHRVGLFDETYHVPCDWGIGVQVDAYAMGGYASPRAFGHGGALSSFGFVDPDAALVVVVQTNGMCGNDDHYARLRDAAEAVYLDLGLVAEGALRREKPMPQVSFAAAGST